LFKASHVSGLAKWFLERQVFNVMTIPPYTPEFNPIERLFCTVKSLFSDNIKRQKAETVFFHIYQSLLDMDYSKFPKYFKCSLYDMEKLLLHMY